MCALSCPCTTWPTMFFFYLKYWLMYCCPISFLFLVVGLLVWKDFLAGSAEAPPVLVPALVEFFSVLLEEDGAALDLRRLFESFLFRLLLLTVLPGMFGGEFSGPMTPPTMVPPPVADIFE